MLITRTSVTTGKTTTMDLDITEEQVSRWENGELIQNVMPHLSMEEREFMISGMLESEWIELFSNK